MPGNIDKTRPERIGEMSFVGTGVSTIPDILEEQKDLRQMMQEMINDALANVVGATVIQDVPDQITYNFGGGGVSQSQLNNAISELNYNLQSQLDWLYSAIRNVWIAARRDVVDLRNQINNLQSGTGRDDPFCRVHLGSNQLNIPDGQWNTVEFDDTTIGAQSVDTHGMWDADNYKMVIPRDGIYQISYVLTMVGVVLDKLYQVLVTLNGFAGVLDDYYYPPAGAGFQHQMGITEFYPLVEGDELQLQLWPGDTGGDTTGLLSGSSLGVYFIRPF